MLDNSTVGGWLSHAINSINRSSIKFSRSAIYRIIGKWKPLDFLLFRYYWRPAENFWLNSSNFPPHTEFCIWTKDVLTFPSLDFIQSCDDYVSGKKSAKKACRFEICTPLLTSSECLKRSTLRGRWKMGGKKIWMQWGTALCHGPDLLCPHFQQGFNSWSSCCESSRSLYSSNESAVYSELYILRGRKAK